MKTIAYLDGFNLFYRALKGKPGVRWLDVSALVRQVMPATCSIDLVNYYTANVSGRVDPTAPVRQQTYLRALETLPDVAIHTSSFIVSKKWAGLVQPPMFRPDFTLPTNTRLDVAYVYKTEEKGSDVNIGVHLVRDAFLGRFNEAALLTNDTDLVEAVRIVTQDLGLRVTLLTPDQKPSTSLRNVATSTRHIVPYLRSSQLPDPVTRPGKRPVHKPPSW